LLTDHATFSSAYGPDWIVFTDPPRHTKLRALISRAFTPRSIANLEPRIREISRGLLEQVIERGEMDLAADFSVPLPMAVIAEMLGIPPGDRPKFVRWNDAILDLSYTIPGGKGDGTVLAEFEAVTAEMDAYLTEVLEQRRAAPRDDLLTRLMHAELDGERLTQEEILGFFQGLLLAGSETTMNLLNSAVLCFLEHPEQLALLRERPDLLPSAIEEVLRYRAPLQWMIRYTTREVEVHGQVIPARKLVLAVIGSANRDPKHFPDPGRFDITREPNPHLAFGHGAHFCMGAPLARLEAKVALSDFLARVKNFRRASDEAWEPRKALHIHGPARLPIRFAAAPRV
jgi:cytochrome P450